MIHRQCFGFVCLAVMAATAVAQLAVLTATGMDYCKILNCFERHIACKNNGSFASTCPPDPKLVDMTQPKTVIVDLYNKHRHWVAGGYYNKFFYALRMAEMQWSDELAALAELNVKQCERKRDRCRSTREFPNVGQLNANYFWADNKTKNSDIKLIRRFINEWMSEMKYSDMFILRKYPRIEPRPLQHHFALAVNEKNTHIGCAALRYYKNNKNRFILTCNFATKTFRGVPVYTYSDEERLIGSGCQTNRSKIHSSLCGKDEVYEHTRVYDCHRSYL